MIVRLVTSGSGNVSQMLSRSFLSAWRRKEHLFAVAHHARLHRAVPEPAVLLNHRNAGAVILAHPLVEIADHLVAVGNFQERAQLLDDRPLEHATREGHDVIHHVVCDEEARDVEQVSLAGLDKTQLEMRDVAAQIDVVDAIDNRPV